MAYFYYLIGNSKFSFAQFFFSFFQCSPWDSYIVSPTSQSESQTPALIWPCYYYFSFRFIFNNCAILSYHRSIDGKGKASFRRTIIFHLLYVDFVLLKVKVFSTKLLKQNGKYQITDWFERVLKNGVNLNVQFLSTN